MSKVAKLVPRPGKKPPAPPSVPPPGCTCEDIQLLIGVLHVTAKCRLHAQPLAPNTTRFYVERDLVAAMNGDYATIDLAQSDRGAPSIAIFCAALMGLMRLIDTAPRTELLMRLHREAEVVLKSLIELPNMETARTQGDRPDGRPESDPHDDSTPGA